LAQRSPLPALNWPPTHCSPATVGEPGMHAKPGAGDAPHDTCVGLPLPAGHANSALQMLHAVWPDRL
jgi:hypothetical protein